MSFTERYAAWQAWFVMRDTSLVNQATFAASLVLTYLLRGWLPAPLREPMRRLYLVGGIPLYLFTLGVGIFNITISPAWAAWLVLAALPPVAAFLIWQWRVMRREAMA